jgi:hypothetical protein
VSRDVAQWCHDHAISVWVEREEELKELGLPFVNMLVKRPEGKGVETYNTEHVDFCVSLGDDAA